MIGWTSGTRRHTAGTPSTDDARGFNFLPLLHHSHVPWSRLPAVFECSLSPLGGRWERNSLGKLLSKVSVAEMERQVRMEVPFPTPSNPEPGGHRNKFLLRNSVDGTGRVWAYKNMELHMTDEQWSCS